MVLEILKIAKPIRGGSSLSVMAGAEAKERVDMAKTTTRLLSRKREKKMTEHQRMKEFADLCQWLGRSKAFRQKGGDRSNVSKTIVKQGLEGCLGYCANVPKNIGKTNYDEGGWKGGIAPMCLRPL